MSDLESSVRDLAEKFRAAVEAAEAGGYRVQWPANVAGLSAIAISETAKVNAPPAPGEEFDAMSKSALVELAAARGIETSGLTKAELIAALKSPNPQG